MLSIDQIASYHRDGFLAIEDFATPDACRALRERADEIVAAFEPTERAHDLHHRRAGAHEQP